MNDLKASASKRVATARSLSSRRALRGPVAAGVHARAGLLIAGALFAASPAAADDWGACMTINPLSDVAIAACTRAIASGQYTGQNVTTLYISRGIAYAAKGPLDRASEDFDQAIRLDPQLAWSDGTNPVAVGDGRFIVCCRAILLDCRAKTSWRFRDTPGNAAEQCIQACSKKLRC